MPNYFFNRTCTKTTPKMCLENKCCILKLPEAGSFTFKDFYQKTPFYSLGFAYFERKKEGASKTKISQLLTNFYEQSAVSWCLTMFFQLENLLK